MGSQAKKNALPVQPLDQKDVIVLCLCGVYEKSGRRCPDFTVYGTGLYASAHHLVKRLLSAIPALPEGVL